MLEEENEGICFGEYGEYEECSSCHLKEACEKFTKAEKEVSIRYQGKYTGKGKEKRKDKY